MRNIRNIRCLINICCVGVMVVFIVCVMFRIMELVRVLERLLSLLMMMVLKVKISSRGFDEGLNEV